MVNDQTEQDFGELIKNITKRSNEENNTFVISNNISPTQKRTTSFTRAEGNATIEDFIEWVNRLVSKILKKYNVEFSADEGSKTKVSPTQTLDHPHIQFTIKSRKPKSGFYAKPRIREEFIESGINNAPGRKGTVYSQIFDYIVQFDILASEYTTANAVMNAFEDAMFNYTAFFKKNGVSEILFLQQYTDSEQDTYRNTVSVRSLQYLVSIEKNRLQYDSSVAIISGTNDEELPLQQNN